VDVVVARMRFGIAGAEFSFAGDRVGTDATGAQALRAMTKRESTPMIHFIGLLERAYIDGGT
jgi:hypothetical protein